MLLFISLDIFVLLYLETSKLLFKHKLLKMIMGGEEGRHHSPGPLLQPAIEGLTHTEGFFHIIHINGELSAESGPCL